MSNIVVIGMQWGDEGKGKIVDLLTPAFDVVVRFQGGHNAGHTVKFADQHFSLHLVPSGIVHPDMKCVLGNGMVIAPDAFFTEIENLAEAGVDTEDRLFVSDRAHVILPELVDLDELREEAAGKGKIGTTTRGIGPAYETKMGRLGVRVGDLSSDALDDRVRGQMLRVEPELVSLGGRHVGHPVRISDMCREWSKRLAPYVQDTSRLLVNWIRSGRRVLFEGAQGTLLDIDHGTYPYVTSSNATAGGACTGAGVPPTAIDSVVGVLKAYTTRVGGGPFVCELEDETGEFLRKRGNEYGTTTGRPRRCGWLDVVAARYSARLNGVGCIALTKLDVLDQLDEIPVCVAYSRKGETIRRFPADLAVLEEATPIFETLPGWRTDTVGTTRFEDLPPAAKAYVEYVERQLEAPVGIISTGPRREETLVRDIDAVREIANGRIGSLG